MALCTCPFHQFSLLLSNTVIQSPALKLSSSWSWAVKENIACTISSLHKKEVLLALGVWKKVSNYSQFKLRIINCARFYYKFLVKARVTSFLHPIRRESKTNCDSLTHAFSPFMAAAVLGVWTVSIGYSWVFLCLFQNESLGTTILYENEFDLHENEITEWWNAFSQRQLWGGLTY